MLTARRTKTARERRTGVFLALVRNAEIIIALGQLVRSVHQKSKSASQGLGLWRQKKCEALSGVSKARARSVIKFVGQTARL